jgi:hypothetical protein
MSDDFNLLCCLPFVPLPQVCQHFLVLQGFAPKSRLREEVTVGAWALRGAQR